MCACHFWFLVRMLYILFLSNKILKVVPLVCWEKTLKHTPKPHEGIQWFHLVLGIFICLHSLQIDLFSHLLHQACFVTYCYLSQRIRVFLSPIISSESWCMWWIFGALNFWKCPSLLEAGSVHVKELFQRIRSSKRKMSLACMEHYHSLSEFFLASHFSTWLHPLGDSWQ